MLGSFRAAVQKARRDPSLYFAPLLSEESILEAFGCARWLWQGWVYTPVCTVWVFLSQCLSMDHSCREAVARLIAWRVARGLSPCSADTGALLYGTGRSAGIGLPSTGPSNRGDLEQESPSEWLWHGRRVRVVDGSTITMPDTGANQAEYPDWLRRNLDVAFPSRASWWSFRWRWGRSWRPPSENTRGSRPARTACSARSTAAWPTTTWRCLTVILAVGSISRCSSAQRRRRRPQASTQNHGLPHRPTPGKRRSRRSLAQAEPAELDVSRDLCDAARRVGPAWRCACE